MNENRPGLPDGVIISLARKTFSENPQIIGFLGEIRHRLNCFPGLEIDALPLVYLGAGGDVVTALGITDRSQQPLIFIQDSHFLLKEYSPPRRDVFVPECRYTEKELIDESGRQSVKLESWVHHTVLVPGLQILSHLERLGFKPAFEKLSWFDFPVGSYKVLMNLPDGNARVLYYINQRIFDRNILSSVLNSLGLGNRPYGLLAKQGAEDALWEMLGQKKGGILPEYFVSGDPRHLYLTWEELGHKYPELNADPSLENEAKVLFPGYAVDEVLSESCVFSNAQVFMNDLPYKSRAVVGARVVDN